MPDGFSVGELVARPTLREDTSPTERAGPAVVHPFLDAVGVEDVLALVELIKALTFLNEIPNTDDALFTLEFFVERNGSYHCLELPHQLPLVVADDQVADG